MTDPNITPDWLKLSSEPVKTRKKRENVSVDQKKLMFEFISENPELITHSSTKECELELWTELMKKLNELQPLKSLNTWRSYWKRWMDKVLSKPEGALTLLDSKVKKFLNNLEIDENKENKSENKENKSEVNNIKDVNSTLKDLEAEKAKLRLEIDTMDCRIVQYKTSLKELSRVVQEKRKRVKDIVTTKKLLNEKKRKLEDRELSANDSDE